MVKRIFHEPGLHFSTGNEYKRGLRMLIGPIEQGVIREF